MARFGLAFDMKVIAWSQNLTPERIQSAQFWADGPGTATPPGHWNQVAIDAGFAGAVSQTFQSEPTPELDSEGMPRVDLLTVADLGAGSPGDFHQFAVERSTWGVKNPLTKSATSPRRRYASNRSLGAQVFARSNSQYRAGDPLSSGLPPRPDFP